MMEQDQSREQQIFNGLTSVGHLGAGLGGLGLGGLSGGLIEERVKVDRKRFEQMLGENSTIGCDADSFFRRVMKSTNTQIMWPPKLKPGTKSKKDPHVRITGSPNSINAAKEIIFEQLDTRRNRVTLKMDVAFTDHSHIIGKGGRSIQRVMDETGCHIHFPDSNRTNTAEKSNQVSIAGSAVGVEQSRQRIREMLPITLQFDLPLNNGLHSPPTLDPQSPQLQAIQQTYGITITFRCDGSKCTNNSYFASSRIITVAVRGARSHLFGLQQGLSVLIEYLTGFRANTINVPLTMTIDVAIQHHSFIAGRSNSNLRSIMQSTGAVISMPDLSCTSATSPPPTSTSANINSSSSGSLSNLMSSAGLSVSCGNTSSTSATLGALTAASSLSDINNPLTSLQHSSFMNAFTDANNNNINNSMKSNNDLNFHGSDSNLTALGSSLSSSTSNLSSRKTAIIIRGQNFDSVYNAWQELLGYLPLILIFDLKEGQDLDPVQVTKLMEQMRQISILIKPKQRQNTKSIVVRGPERDSRLLFEVRRQILKLDDSEVQGQYDPQLLEKQLNLTPPLPDKSILKPQQSNPQQVLARHALQPHQPENSVHQQFQQLQQQQPQQQQPQHHHQQQQHQHQHHNPDQQQQSTELQMKAIRAILEPNLQKPRQPTPYWSGLGFSKSVSEPMIKEKLSVGPLFSSNVIDERRTSTDTTNDNALQGLTSSLQSLQLNGQQKVSSCLKLAVFLGRIGLVQYLSLFTSRNIDLEMLFGLSDADFAELGLPYVHRRKLAIAIAEFKSLIMNDQRSSSTFDAAPGAERSRRYKVGSTNQGDLKDVWPM